MTISDYFAARELAGSEAAAVAAGLLTKEEVDSFCDEETRRWEAAKAAREAVSEEAVAGRPVCPLCGCKDGHVSISRGLGRCENCRPIHVWQFSRRPRSLRGATHRRC